jgi:hypothetical protein
MAVTPEDVAQLDERAHQVDSRSVGRCRLGPLLTPGSCTSPPIPSTTTATCATSLCLSKPMDEVIVHEVDMLLDQLERGERRIIANEDRDPRLV